MNNKNYQKLLDEELAKAGTKEKTVVLHGCCAPCSSYCLSYLAGKIKIVSYYYNPNITEEAEYRHRADELARLVECLNEEIEDAKVVFKEGAFEPEKFYEKVKGLEMEQEGGKRCEKCFELRLYEAARLARELGADYFSTTLTISPLKNAQLLNEIGERIAKETGVKFLPSDFKKKEGYKQSVELSKKYGLYRQDYCGCPYSKRDRMASLKKNGEDSI